MMFDLHPIRTEAYHKAALATIEAYFDAPPVAGSAEGDRFDILAALIEAYEIKHWPTGDIDPVDFIREAMAIRGLAQKDLAMVLGSASRASEILARRRPLTLAMVQKLTAKWGLPAEALVKPYALTG